jgi:hypothetical protein
MIKPTVSTDKDTYHLRLLKSTVKRLVKRDYRHKTVENYVIEWNSAFELSELDEAQVEATHAQAQQTKLGWMSKDEIRAEEGLDPLPDGAGEWKDPADVFGGGGEEFLVKSKQGMKPKDERKPHDDKHPEVNEGNKGSKDNAGHN